MKSKGLKILGLSSLLICLMSIRVLAATMQLGATLSGINGEVLVKPAQDPEWVAGVEGQGIKTGTRIITRHSASCILKWSDGHFVKLGPSTEITVSSLMLNPENKTENSEFNLKSGTVTVKARKFMNNQSYLSIETPTASIKAHGTLFQAAVGADSSTAVNVLEGFVDVSAGGRIVQVGANQGTFVAANSLPMDPQTLSPDVLSRLVETGAAIEPPLVVVTEPDDGVVMNQGQIMISGTTERTLTLNINNQPVPLSPDGSFNSMLYLAPGENQVILIADSGSGMKTVTARSVTYLPLEPSAMGDKTPSGAWQECDAESPQADCDGDGVPNALDCDFTDALVSCRKPDCACVSNE